MSARILVVDDILANVRLMEARLTAEYFNVFTAISGTQALEMLDNAPFDIVLLDVMMPGLDGFEVCRRIRATPSISELPVVMVTALDQPSDRIRGLEAGADDFLTKPVSDIQLITRVKSLVRLKQLGDELVRRVDRAGSVFASGLSYDELTAGDKPRVLIIDSVRASYERVASTLTPECTVDVETGAQEAVFRAADGGYDLLIVDLSFPDFDALRLVSQLKSLDRTRHTPILLITEPQEIDRLERGLELGINDYLVRPLDRQELLARCRTQIRRKRFGDRLQASLNKTMDMAVNDELTGLQNRRFLDGHLACLLQKAKERDDELSLLFIDIDFFKKINDTYGHAAGDSVLREFAERIRRNLRTQDLACRYGGEEFVIVMPGTSRAAATVVAERLRERIARNPFAIDGGGRFIDVTISIGLASRLSDDDTPETLLKRADVALYRAKSEGRNRVTAAA